MYEADDRSQELDEFHRQQALETQLIKSRQRQADLPQFKDWDGVTCFTCGDDLPPLRIKEGRVRCTTCQASLETKR